MICIFLFGVNFNRKNVFVEAQNIAPDGNYYTNSCSTIVDDDAMDYVEFWFNDTGNGCVSEDWYVRYHPPGSPPQDETDETYRNQGLDPFIDFSVFGNCCQPIAGGGCSTCDWEYNAATNELIIYCDECGEYD